MKAKIAFVVFVVASLFLAGNSQAVMHRVVFNAFTSSQDGQPDLLLVKVDVFDDVLKHPPDFVSEIKITAPDGTVKLLDLSKSWRVWDHAFIQPFFASDFEGGVIPGGRYTAKVTSLVGSAITEADSVAAKFLVPPPSPGPQPEKPELVRRPL